MSKVIESHRDVTIRLEKIGNALCDGNFIQSIENVLNICDESDTAALVATGILLNFYAVAQEISTDGDLVGFLGEKTLTRIIRVFITSFTNPLFTTIVTREDDQVFLETIIKPYCPDEISARNVDYVGAAIHNHREVAAAAAAANHTDDGHHYVRIEPVGDTADLAECCCSVM